MDALICYLPVIHSGYLELFKRFPKANTALFIIGGSFTRNIREFQKDIRAIPPKLALKIIKDLDLFYSASIIETFDGNICGFNPQLYQKIYLPADSVSRDLVANSIFKNLEVEFVDYFLRWDSDSAKAHIDVDCKTVDGDDFLRRQLQIAVKEGQKSTDIYRQVGCVLFRRGGKILVGHNNAYPNENLPFYEGDPRSLFKKGIHIDLSTALHAEARLISEAARLGICTEGMELVVTDFPCPPCAKLIANAGIKKVFYMKGYAVLDGERNLREKGVEIYKINTPPE